MAIKTFINGQENGVITFKDDTEPCAVYVNGERQDNISYIPDVAEGVGSATYTSEYKNNLRTLQIAGNTEQDTYGGYNLFNIDAVTGASYRVDSDNVGISDEFGTITNGVMHLKYGLAKRSIVWNGSPIPIRQGGNYYISCDVLVESGATTHKIYCTLANMTKNTYVQPYSQSSDIATGVWTRYIFPAQVVPDTWVGDKVLLCLSSVGDGTQGSDIPIYAKNVMVTYDNDTDIYEPYYGGTGYPSIKYPQKIKSCNNAILPSEYKQVEYIESTGTQYIDTGVLGKNTLSFYTKATYASATLFGTQDNSTGNKCIAFAATWARYLSSNGVNVAAGLQSVANYEFEMSNTKATVYYNGTSSSASLSSTNTTVDYPIYLFARNLNGNASGFSSVKIYSFKIWDNGTLVRDYIPCYRKSDNVIGLYDLVNGVFYTNAGTGTFLKGADISTTTNPTIANPAPITNCGNSQVDMTLETRGANLFDIDNPLIVYPSQYAINENLTPKIENGVIYSGGVGNSYGGFLCVETDEKSVYTISFDANFDETTQIKTRCSIAKFNSISNGIMSDTVINEKTTVKGKNVFDTNANGYRYIGVAFHSNTKYGMEITNLTIENTITDIVLDCDVSKIKANTNPSTTANYISNVNVENKSITITTPVDIPTTDIGYRGTGVKFNALFPNAEVGKKYLLKFKNSLMGYCRNAMFLTGANPNKTWGNNTVETLTQGMFDAGVVLYGYDISAHKNTDPLPLPANAVISDITLTEVLEPIKTTVSIPANIVLESGANETLLELAKIGDIADTITIDRVNNEVKYIQRICRVRPFVNVGGRLEFDGSASGNPDAWFFLPNKNAQVGIGKCEFSPITNDITGENEFSVIIYDTLIIINTPKSLGLNSPEALENYLMQTGNFGLSIFYVLEKPIEWTITDNMESMGSTVNLKTNLLEWAKSTKNQTNIIEITSTPSVTKTSVNYAKWGGVPNENNT